MKETDIAKSVLARAREKVHRLESIWHELVAIRAKELGEMIGAQPRYYWYETKTITDCIATAEHLIASIKEEERLISQVRALNGDLPRLNELVMEGEVIKNKLT